MRTTGHSLKPFRANVGLLLALVLLPRLAVAANVADFNDFSLRNASNQVVLPGRLYVPPEASNTAVPRPFILFLHGVGEDGSNNTSQINVNIDNLLAEAKRRGAYLYAPQTIDNWGVTTTEANILSMIQNAEATQNVDAHRLYITGLSSGGGGTWTMASRFPGVFAAALPIASVGPSNDFTGSPLLNEPIWSFHARDDPTVFVGVERSTVNKVLTAAHQTLPVYPAISSTSDFLISNPDLPLHQTVEALIQGTGVSEFRIPGSHLDLMYYEFTTGGHSIWPTVYAWPPVYDWLFAHSIPEPSTLMATLIGAIVGLTTVRRRHPHCTTNRF
jgi:predicted peptidase